MDAFNGYHIRRKFCATAVVYSDASDSSFGGFSTLVGDHVSFGHWNEFEASQSSIFKELKALLHALQSFSAVLSHHKVNWFSDSQNSCRIVSEGTSKPELRAITKEIFEVCMSFDIAMEIEWLPRSQNDKADYLSRIVDLDDWSMSAALFQLVVSSWGPHTVDRFASFYNTQVPRCSYSRFWNLESEVVEAFTQDWSRDNNRLCPPVSIIVHAVRHLIASKGVGGLIITK